MFKNIATKIKSLLGIKTPQADRYISVGKFSLLTTAEDRLPEYFNAFPNYSINFARLASWIIKEDDEKSAIVDIGANIGDTIALLRSYGVQNPIIAVEGSDLYFNILKANAQNFQNVTLVKSFLGSKQETITGNVTLNNGTGRITEIANGNEIEISTLDTISKDLKFNHVRILKVDTDGYDVSILNGSIEILKKDHPIIFFEYDTDLNLFEQTCFDFLISLQDMGYSKVIFYDNYGRMLTGIELNDSEVILHLDRYIKNKKGAFEYYDVAVFHENDTDIYNEVIAKELAIN